MKISWLGHSCFRIEDGSGRVVVTDPFDEAVGYPLPKTKADVVTISHDHHDHNNVRTLKGNPAVVRGPGKKAAAGIEFRGIASYHDDQGGKRRGKNTIFSFEMDGIRVCHLGDLGHLLSEEDAAALGEVDVLMIPVGGVYTLDAGGAKKVVGQIRPKVVIPMHFMTPALTFKVESADRFLSGQRVERPGHTLEVSKETLPKGGEGPLIVLLDYK
ncbi:MAG TPA: MBL fold metallo-hydrolase [Methanothrix sp.]|nr:MBL fold metallo-hydrolase [Methanothrix sp.]